MRKYLPSKRTAKAVAAGVVSLAAYLVGVVPAEGGFGDVTTVQWLGAVVFLGGAYGITYRVSNTEDDPGESGQAASFLVMTAAVASGFVIGVILTHAFHLGR